MNVTMSAHFHPKTQKYRSLNLFFMSLAPYIVT